MKKNKYKDINGDAGMKTNIEIWNELSAYKAKRKKKNIMHGIISPICNIIFILCALPITVVAITAMNNSGMTELIKNILGKYIVCINGRNINELFCDKIFNFDTVTVAVLSAAPFVISFTAAVLMSIILALVVHPKKARADEKDLRNDEQAMRICKTLVSVMPDLRYYGQFIISAIIPATILAGSIFIRKIGFPTILLTVATCIAVYAVMLLALELSTLFNSILYRFGPNVKRLSPMAYEILTSDRFSSVLSDMSAEGIKASEKPSGYECDDKSINGKRRMLREQEKDEDYENQRIGLKIYYDDNYGNSEFITVSVFVDEICMGTLTSGCNAFYVENGIHTLKAEICNTHTGEVKTISGGGFKVEDGFYETDLGKE